MNQPEELNKKGKSIVLKLNQHRDENHLYSEVFKKTDLTFDERLNLACKLANDKIRITIQHSERVRIYRETGIITIFNLN